MQFIPLVIIGLHTIGTDISCRGVGKFDSSRSHPLTFGSASWKFHCFRGVIWTAAILAQRPVAPVKTNGVCHLFVAKFDLRRRTVSFSGRRNDEGFINALDSNFPRLDTVIQTPKTEDLICCNLKCIGNKFWILQQTYCSGRCMTDSL